jgi:hypothetical protein
MRASTPILRRARKLEKALEGVHDAGYIWLLEWYGEAGQQFLDAVNRV